MTKRTLETENYKFLGKLPQETIDFFKDEILKRKEPNNPYQWIKFDYFLNEEFLKIFKNTELEIQQYKGMPVQKVFYSDPGHGFRIHKDGINCRSALNIALSCNEGDWVRWYDEELINKLTQTTVQYGKKTGSSRNTDIFNYEKIPYIDELKNEVGDVYVLNVEKYHSFKCIGKQPRLILQTKFEGFPVFEVIKDSLSEKSFENLIKFH